MIIALLALVLVAVVVIGAAALRPAPPARYEYQLKMVNVGEFQADMRILGESGWQLVTTRYVESDDPANPGRKIDAYDCVLMRPALGPAVDLP